MNHPCLYPDQAPWTDDYQDLRSLHWHHAHSSMNYLGQLPVRVNHHIGVSDAELNALVNACSFFYEYFSPGSDISLQDWRAVARDENLALYDQLASKLASI